MSVLNNISSCQQSIEAVFGGAIKNASQLADLFEQKLQPYRQYIHKHLNDMPEIKNWKCS